MVTPTEESLKDFKQKIKDKTRKTLTLSKEEWVKKLNPIIRGKVNYYLNIHKAIEENKRLGQGSRCFIKGTGTELHKIDAYTRRRLRIAMIHKNPDQRKGWLMTSKWTNEYFVRIGLIPGNWLFYNVMYEYDLELYITRQKERAQKKHKNQVERYKRLGKNYYDAKRVAQMKAAQAYRTT